MSMAYMHSAFVDRLKFLYLSALIAAEYVDLSLTSALNAQIVGWAWSYRHNIDGLNEFEFSNIRDL